MDHKRNFIIAIILLLIAVVAVFWYLRNNSEKQIASSPTPTYEAVYTDPERGYSLEVPPDFKKETGGGNIQITRFTDNGAIEAMLVINSGLDVASQLPEQLAYHTKGETFAVEVGGFTGNARMFYPTDEDLSASNKAGIFEYISLENGSESVFITLAGDTQEIIGELRAILSTISFKKP